MVVVMGVMVMVMMVVVMVVIMVVVMVVVMMMVIVWWSAGSPRPSVWPLVDRHTSHTSLHTLSLSLSLMALTARLWP